jgi:hypothetical protein
MIAFRYEGKYYFIGKGKEKKSGSLTMAKLKMDASLLPGKKRIVRWTCAFENVMAKWNLKGVIGVRPFLPPLPLERYQNNKKRLGLIA